MANWSSAQSNPLGSGPNAQCLFDALEWSSRFELSDAVWSVRNKLNRARKRAGGLGGSKLVHSADWLAPGDYVLRPHLRDKIRPVIH